jgi:RNA polymerase sigma-70 factor (sigma-E family)
MLAERDLASLYAAVAPRSIRLACLLTGDQAFAEDVVQEAFIRVASRLGGLRDPGAVEAYLRKAVVNEVLGRRRSLARQARREDLAARQLARVPDSPMRRVEDRVDLLEALNTLPPRQRTAILLKYWLDLSEADIAETMRCAPGTVKSTLARGLAALREVVGSDD